MPELAMLAQVSFVPNLAIGGGTAHIRIENNPECGLEQHKSKGSSLQVPRAAAREVALARSPSPEEALRGAGDCTLYITAR